MHRIILLPLILLIICVQAKAQSDRFQTNVPQEVQKFILKDYKVYDYREGDLNGDGTNDAILILQNNKQGEYDSISNDYLDFPIPFMVLVRNQQNHLELKTKNDSVLTHLCSVRTYEGTTIDSTKHQFTIDFFGGRRFKWSRSLTFQYKKQDNEFHLIEDNNGGADSFHPEKEDNENYETKEDELVGITITNFNYDVEYLETDGKVIADKTYFYSNPDLKSKHRKGYLQKGDNVEVMFETVNFASVYYLGKNDKYTSGFLLKKDLNLTRKPIKTK